MKYLFAFIFFVLCVNVFLHTTKVTAIDQWDGEHFHCITVERQSRFTQVFCK